MRPLYKLTLLFSLHTLFVDHNCFRVNETSEIVTLIVKFNSFVGKRLFQRCRRTHWIKDQIKQFAKN